MKKRYKYNVPELTKQVTVGEIDIDMGTDFYTIAPRYEDKKDRWTFYMYPKTKYTEIGGDADKSWIEGLEPRDTRILYDPDIILEAQYGTNYVGHAVAYLHAQVDTTIIRNLITIERGCLYLNDEKIVITPNWSWVNNINLKLKKGWNKIEVLYVANNGQNGFDWSGNGLYNASPLVTMYSELFDYDINIKKLINTEEVELSKINIKGKSSFNVLGEDLWDDYYILHDDAKKLDDEDRPYWAMWKGDMGLRFRMSVDHAFTGTGWHWRTVCQLHNSKKAALLKPLTTYTLTYYVHEAQVPSGGQVEYNIWIGNSRWALKREVGMQALTFKTDAKPYDGSAYLMRELYAGPSTIFNKGDRRIFDVEFISLVEGDKGIAYKSNTLTSSGIGDEIDMFVQDCNPTLGEYELQGDIPSKLEDIENVIENNIELFGITWI